MEVCMWEIRLHIPSAKTLCVLNVIINLIKVKRTSIVVVRVLAMLFCVRQTWGGLKIRKHILKDPIDTVLYINKMRYNAIAIAAMKWSWHNRNWSDICIYYHPRQGSLWNKISWWVNIVPPWKPTKTSADFDCQSSVLIRYKIQHTCCYKI